MTTCENFEIKGQCYNKYAQECYPKLKKYLMNKIDTLKTLACGKLACSSLILSRDS